MTESCVFRGAEGFSIKNDRIEAVLLRAGAKIASLRKNGVEYLYQGRSKTFMQPRFEGNFGEYDLSGFDDMVPTINAGFIQDGIFAGVHLADHGEVWALGWKVEAGVEEIRAEVDGVRLPYHLSKRLTLRENVLSIQYELRNKGEFAFPCLWAAHILIAADENTRIIPAEIKKAVRSTLDMSSRLGGFGAVHAWPETRDRRDVPYFLDRLPPRDAKVCEKYYFEGPLKDGRIRIRDPDMIIRFDPETVPFAGIWLNSNGYKDQYNMGIEPATAPMDSPENAKQWGYPAELQGHGVLRWTLEIEAG
jgi:galactose mutarotase-like enzyme